MEAIAIQDKVFVDGDYQDEHYAQRRKNILTVAVNCTRAADTCFCASLNTGPKANNGFDLALTEVINHQEHYFALEVGSDLGAEVIRPLNLALASNQQHKAATTANQQAEQQQRTLNPEPVKQLLYDNLENQGFWRQVADRC